MGKTLDQTFLQIYTASVCLKKLPTLLIKKGMQIKHSKTHSVGSWIATKDKPQASPAMMWRI